MRNTSRNGITALPKNEGWAIVLQINRKHRKHKAVTQKAQRLASAIGIFAAFRKIASHSCQIRDRRSILNPVSTLSFFAFCSLLWYLNPCFPVVTFRCSKGINKHPTIVLNHV
jgi:hypothetical protein